MTETTQTITETMQPMAAEMVASTEAKPYTFRTLSSQDVFPMFKIISLIGVNEFTACFEKDGIKNMLNKLTGGNAEEVEMTSIVGISVMLEIANVIFGNLPKCEEYIYQLLSQTSNLSVVEIKGLDMVVFTEMVIDFIKKDEFKDFFRVASKLFR